jgi:hypothetical protein
MGEPVRVQLSRKKGWRMPENTVRVSRPGKWGNQYTAASEGSTERAIARYENRLIGLLQIQAIDLRELRGKNLACWCKIGEPCHADVLLKLANPSPVAGTD